VIRDGVLFFNVALCAYFAAFSVLLIGSVFHRRKLEPTGLAILGLGIVAHTIGLGVRSAMMGALAITTTYETLAFYAWGFAATYLAVRLAMPRIVRFLRPLGPVVVLIAFAALAVAASPLFPSQVRPLVPALRSSWLALHVSLTILGEGFFALGFVSSVLYLLISGRAKTPVREARASALDLLAYRSVAIGFPLFTMGGLLFGAIWAQHAWGTYWSWDPKETFTLVTWLVYVAYLHMRIGRGRRGMRPAWLAVAGFLLALFTFVGVNFLLRGLHSYA
jgi:cytochrome c-type biogenesis protein CcsB